MSGVTETRWRIQPGARLRAALSLWSVRALAVIFLLGSAVGLLSIREGHRLQGDLVFLEAARSEQIRLDECLEAVQALKERLLAAVRTDDGSHPYALETQSLRDRLQGLGTAVPTGTLLEAVGRVDAFGRDPAAGTGAGAAEAARLRELVEARWQQMRAMVRDSSSQDFQAQVWRMRERAEQRRWILVLCGLAAVAVIVIPLWISGEGVLQAEAQVRALAAGQAGPTPPGPLGELRALRAALGDLGAALAAQEGRRLDEHRRRERHRGRLQAALTAIADGDPARALPPAEVPEWAGVMTVLERIIVEGRRREERAAAEHALLQKQALVPREEIYQINQLFDLDPDKQAAAAHQFAAESPLRTVAQRIAEISRHRRSLLAQVQERAGKILEHSGTLATAVKDRETDFRRESQLIHETSTTVNEVSVAAKQTAQMVEFVFRSSQEAMQAAEDGRDLVRRSIDGMNVIKNRVNQIAEQILQLSGKSQEVGTIVRVIGDISKQTNLLALNAAIEAAGAGEHGKGFAVVAKEIRELAVKSSRSTQDIQQLIQEIQAATNSAVLSTEEGSKSVQGGVRLVHALNQAFGQVIEKFQEVVESAQQISTAAQEQTAGARQVASSIGSIDQMVRSTVEDLQGLRQMLEDYQGITREFADLLRAQVAGGPGA